ncbi:MAG TPA: peptidoglycan bridge formation glycyltransferase FemA/FemB family protein [Candidatus Limnocylindria bacterium]|nr:peptidoglycan bridge formation glycyltransferase FemA/FemB family protein [Candidatus Limnocylindria bacterium]
MIKVRPATEADHAAWQDLLGRCGSGDFLHDWSWADVAAFDGQPQRRFVAEDDGELVALAAAQVRRLPLGRSFWYVPHGPVLDYAHPHAADRLRAVAIGLREAARRDRAIAVKLEPRLERGAKAAAAFGRLRHEPGTLQVGQTRLVELADDETLLAGFDKDTRYAVRRAEREGVEVTTVTDAGNLEAIDALHALVLETQRRAGFPKPPLQRYRLAWRGLASAGRATIFEARRQGELLASGMLVVEGNRSFYLFSGSRREEPGKPKRYASYALQMAMMRHARAVGATTHDLWGVAPEDATPDHPWYGVGLFKKGFGGRVVVWAGTWDIVVDRTLYRMRGMAAEWRGAARAMIGRLRAKDR